MPMGPNDSVDRLLSSWARAVPDLDLSPVAIVARIGRLARIFSQELEATYAEHGLNGPDFAALVTLRRLARPDGASQRQLMRELDLTSGTVSVRVERLVERGLVTRTTDPADRRNSLVALTDAGQALFDRVTPAHVETENRLLAALSSVQRDELVEVLRTLLLSFEGSAGDARAPRIGVALAPTHVALEIRRAVGLPDHIGLLVRGVQPGSRADAAGIKQGDVLVRAGGHELRSITTLYAAIGDAIPQRMLEVSVIRGVDSELTARIDLSPRSDDEQAARTQLAAAETAAHTI
jgi:DNA-binding MarR family transcriptional regulator